MSSVSVLLFGPCRDENIGRCQLTSREYSVKEEMKRLLGKYPKGIAGFEMGLTPTAARAETQVARKRRRVRATL